MIPATHATTHIQSPERSSHCRTRETVADLVNSVRRCAAPLHMLAKNAACGYGFGAGGPTGGVTVPGSDFSLGIIFVIRKSLKIVGQYSFTILFSALKPIR